MKDIKACIAHLENQADYGDSEAMCQLVFWYVGKDNYMTVDMLAHAAMRGSPTAMTIMADLMPKDDKVRKGRYGSWRIALYAYASACSEIAEERLKAFDEAEVRRIQLSKFGKTDTSTAKGFRTMCLTLEMFSYRLLKRADDVEHAVAAYAMEYKAKYGKSFASWENS